MSKYVIIHGQLREISDDELMHWKYIKREKKNGKWVYYYDEKEANKELRPQQKLVAEAKARESVAQLEYAANKKLADAMGLNDGRNTFYGNEIAVKNRQARSANKYNSAKRHTEKVVKKYERMKLGRNIKKSVSTGIVKIANIFSGAGNKQKG